jgi:hypothetical protein
MKGKKHPPCSKKNKNIQLFKKLNFLTLFVLGGHLPFLNAIESELGSKIHLIKEVCIQ